MIIYVAGPYMPRGIEPNSPEAQQLIANNINAANRVAISLMKIGHTPFVPHTMMRGWEDIEKLSRETILQACKKWVERSDALYFIASSPGAEIERALAEQLGLPVFEKLDDVPRSEEFATQVTSERAMRGYFLEY